MKNRLLAGTVAIAVLAAGCSTLTVSSDWDHTVNFSQYKAFTLKEGTKANNSLIQGRIERAVTATLQSKGLTSAPDASLLVYTHARQSVQKVVDYNTYGYGGWYGWYGWGAGGWSTTTATVRDVPVGTLIVDLVDAKKKALIWRGTATDTFESGADVTQERVDDAVKKLFAGYPPEAGK